MRTFLMLCLVMAPVAASDAQQARPPVPTRAPIAMPDLTPLLSEVGPQLDIAAMQLQAAAPQLQAVGPQLDALAPRLEAAQAQLQAAGFQGLASRLAAAQAQLQAAGLQNMAPELEAAQARLEALDPEDALQSETGEMRLPTSVPPQAWNANDPGDSLYRAAREALNDEDYTRAASLFHQLRERFPKSDYASDAPYWEAFALYRNGGQQNLNRALDVLKMQQDRYPKAATIHDAATLDTRIRGELARQGEASQAAAVAQLATVSARSDAAAAAEGAARATSAASAAAMGSDQGRTSRGDTTAGCASEDDNDIRLVALNALLQMDADRALPILKQVLARRDACSEVLRRKAVFLVAQKAHSDEGASILLNVARTDPDREVRRQAVFWLSQVPTDRAVAALDSILMNSSDEDMQEKALFALSQHQGSRSAQILRDYAAKSTAPEELRGKAIFWLGQMDRGSNGDYLRTLYGRVNNAHLRESIVQAIAQQGGTQNVQWLLGIVKDTSTSTDVRRKALFWAGQQQDIPLSDLMPLYNSLSDPKLKQYFIFVLSQRSEPAAVDKLIDIAKNDPDRDMRKKAIFWLSQKDDPRVQQVLLDIINQR
ncbi:MAG TPA: HEAT repeat domain-containing protein [Gemmatimonadaceae bacterium]|nr:HEAT repeat domain-containing protein [Gemmatimonadaceae bacterium]